MLNDKLYFIILVFRFYRDKFLDISPEVGRLGQNFVPQQRNYLKCRCIKISVSNNVIYQSIVTFRLLYTRIGFRES